MCTSPMSTPNLSAESHATAASFRQKAEEAEEHARRQAEQLRMVMLT